MSVWIMKNARQGFRRPNGFLVRMVQRRLLSKGFNPKGVDGDFGGNTLKALQNWQADQGFSRLEGLTEKHWLHLFEAPAPTLFDRCLQMTADFEGHDFTLAKGNFDGAGITWGVIGFTLVHGDIKRIVEASDNVNPDIINEAFGTLATQLRELVQEPKTKQIEFANNITIGKGRLRKDWQDAFDTFGQHPTAEGIQIKRAKEIYWSKALRIMDFVKLNTKLGMAMCFDVAVQNGIDDDERRELINKVGSGSGTDLQRRERMAEIVARNSHPKWFNDVFSRKLALARGEGLVHGARYDISDWGIEAIDLDDQDKHGLTITLPEDHSTIAASNAPLSVLPSDADVAHISTSDDINIGIVEDETLSLKERFQARLDEWGIVNFSAEEIFFLGASHHNPKSSGFSLNTEPPEHKWDHIKRTVEILQKARTELGKPLLVLSAYRSEAYNKAIGGAKKSMHKQFRAIDVRSPGMKASDLAEIFHNLRNNNQFTGGIGTYIKSNFVHIDTGRSQNATWSS